MIAVQLQGSKNLTPVFPESTFTKKEKKFINFKDENNQRRVAVFIPKSKTNPTPFWKEVDY